MTCPFARDGAPVLGQAGYTEQGVVIMTLATWNKLCEDVPDLAKTQFQVGTVE